MKPSSRCALAVVVSLAGSTGLATADDTAVSDDEDAPPEVETLISTTESDADLRVKQLPARLKMRPPSRADAPKEHKDVAQASTPGTPQPGGDAAAAGDDSGGSVGYKMFPTTRRDLRERVTFRIRAGMQVDTAPANGEFQRGGLALPGDFADTRPWLLGDAAVGARGIITPSLNGYFLTSFALDASDSLATRTATILPYDNQALAIKAAYGEWGYDDRKPDDLQKYNIWLRGGRQFRLDGGNLFAYFDGATLGYRGRSFSTSVFAGQRVALYVDTEAGLTFGATAALDMKPGFNIPFRLAVDYMGLQIDVRDQAETRHMIALNAQTRLGKKGRFDVRVRGTGLPDFENVDAMGVAPTKFALGRAGGRLRYDTGRLILVGDAEYRFADDVAYDLATPAAVDIVNVAEQLGVGLAQPIDALRVGGRLDWLTESKKFEVLLFGAAELPQDTPVTVDQKAYVEGGVGIAGTPLGVRGSGVYTTAQYTYRQYTDESVVDGMRIDGVGSDFGNSAFTGLDQMHQIAAEAALATRGSGGKRWRFGAGGFFRVYNWHSPYREVKDDARGGGRVDLQWWFQRDLHLHLAGEIAQASPTLARELGTMTSLRAALEARW